ncbi:DUF5615 family PIN-like protein [Corynebacterium sp.]|uniref:DUF5615 family PIN-like protein n=1 Tax=Corynebacterium sp. TaxID=1720 RepID=UPI003B3AB7D0
MPGAAHLRDVLETGTSDVDIIAYAAGRAAVVITADTDFGTLLAATGRSRPSVVLVRELLQYPVADQARLIMANLPGVADALGNGAVVVFGKDKIRVRTLPIE